MQIICHEGDIIVLIEKVKNAILKSKLLKVFIFIILIVILIFYLRLFLTTGIRYDDTFLKKDVVASETHYDGNSSYGALHIEVNKLNNNKNSVEVIYDLPQGINQHYLVNFTDVDTWNLGINIKNDAGEVLFEGTYQKDQPFLIDKNGEPFVEDAIQIIMNEESPYNSDYKIYLKNTADLACFSTESVRGNYALLIVAILLLIIIVIDIRFPLFFFYLRNFLSVKDPEPSDLYLFIQRISWYVGLVIVIILFISAVAT